MFLQSLPLVFRGYKLQQESALWWTRRETRFWRVRANSGVVWIRVQQYAGTIWTLPARATAGPESAPVLIGADGSSALRERNASKIVSATRQTDAVVPGHDAATGDGAGLDRTIRRARVGSRSVDVVDGAYLSTAVLHRRARKRERRNLAGAAGGSDQGRSGLLNGVLLGDYDEPSVLDVRKSM